MGEIEMKGLFTTTQTQTTSLSNGKLLTCISCGLLHNTKHKFKPYGLGAKGIMIIGDTPTNREDEMQKPFLDGNGRILRNYLTSKGIDLYKDCYSLYACSCVCNDDKIPNYPIEACRKNVDKYIKELKPKVIIALGVEALISLIGNKYKENIDSVEKWRKWTIPDNDRNCWICPTYHYNDFVDDEVGELLFKQDLDIFLSLKSLPKQEKPNVHIIDDLSVLNEITSDLVSIDYETTGIKPHDKGHRIVCASVAYDENNCYSFLMPETRQGRQPFIDLLLNPNIRKMAHNMKFEHAWTLERLKVEVQNWYWDSMIAAHILDNRSNICGLKFLAFVMLGVEDYSSEVSEYLHSPGKSDNALNKVIELSKINKEKLLTYCGLDTIYQYRIALKQMEEMGI